MEKIWVKFLKDYDTHKKDDVVQIPKEDSKALLQLKLVEETTVEDDPELDKVVQSFGKKLEQVMELAVTASTKKVGDLIDKTIKLPAVPIDHDEEGRRGFKSFDEFLRDVARAKPGMQPSEKLMALSTKAPTGMETGDDVEGGFLIPETFAAGLWEQAVPTDSVFGRTDRRTTGGNSIVITGWAKDSLERPYRYAGVRAYWTAEAGQYTASQPKFRRMRLELHKLSALIYSTDEEMEDSAYNIEALNSAKAADAIQFEIADSMFNGTGVGKPLGILRSEATVWVQPEVGQQVDSELRMENIIKMYHRMASQFRSGGVWYMHPSTYEMLFYLSFLNNRQNNSLPLFMPMNMGITGAPQGTLIGRPIELCEYLPAPGGAGSLVFANFSQMATLTKSGGGLKRASSMHVRFLFDEMAFKYSFRVDGQPTWLSPMKDLNGNVYRSPFVALNEVITGATSSGM